ncbi:MAG TPA: thioesterase domain-containing protein [Thermoanaerobaculia bacterium]|nr:thioesterase domain-containing protein [Thermoanaerobaculia bacterium]
MHSPRAGAPWAAFHRPSPHARLRLFCFPFAGGSALVYREWHRHLPERVEVVPIELPGRASRFREPLMRQADQVVAAAGAGLAPLFDRPFALFGHSMGALLVFELARWLRRQGLPAPLQIFASGRQAPDIAEHKDLHALPDDDLLARLREFNGTPEEVLKHPELMQMMLPVLRADFEVNETYRYCAEPPLASSLSAWGGLADPEVPREELEAWRVHTSAGFDLRMFAGDHFFLLHHPPDLMRVLATETERLAAGL